MKIFDINKIVRPNVLKMEPYSSARDEFEGSANIFLDANENSLGSLAGEGYNRYPDPRQTPLRVKVAELKGVKPEQVFFGNGSDEPIDLLYRAFCQPNIDRVILLPPTYGMYKVQANINETPIDEVLLTSDFQLDTDAILKAVKPESKIIFICSPNNPSGNLMKQQDVIKIIENFNGLVAVDEAYIDFANSVSFTTLIEKYPNLIVLQTFSKAWGLAALRLGMAFAQKPIIDILCKIKYPYNINILTQNAVYEALTKVKEKDAMVNEILEGRKWLEKELPKITKVQKVYSSDANFILVKIDKAAEVYKILVDKGIVVRNRSNVKLCDDCLRITVGTEKENKELISTLTKL